jgi:hypothetical protein
MSEMFLGAETKLIWLGAKAEVKTCKALLPCPSNSIKDANRADAELGKSMVPPGAIIESGGASIEKQHPASRQTIQFKRHDRGDTHDAASFLRQFQNEVVVAPVDRLRRHLSDPAGVHKALAPEPQQIGDFQP